MKKSSTVLIYDNSGNVLLGKRKDTKKWSFIGGGQDEGETPNQCISREVLEEVGLNVLPENYTLLGTTKLPEVALNVFELKTNRDWQDFELTSTLDPDGEFEEVRFFSIDGVEQLANDNLLHIPALSNVAYAYLMENKKGLFGTLSQMFNNMFGTKQDDIQLDSLGFKEQRALQKELKGLFKELNSGELSFREQRVKQKRVKEIFTLLKGGGTQDNEPSRVEKIAYLRKYISPSQMSVIVHNFRGEEGDFFKKKVDELYKTIKEMPTSYQTDGQGDNAVAYLHYFNAGSDWYITENDKEMPPEQAFGLVSLNGGEPELGYISITELVKHGVELDLYWKPKTLGAVKGEETHTEENSSFDYDTAEQILTKNPDDLTTHDIDWFFQDGRLDALENLVSAKDSRALKILELASKVNSLLTVDTDSINLFMDSIDNTQIAELLGDAFLDVTPKGRVDEKKREKAISKIRKKLKTDNEFRKSFFKIVKSIGVEDDKE